MSEQEASLDAFISEADGQTVEEEYDQHLPEIEKIPEDWSLITVEDVADNLVGGGTPSKSNDDYWDGDIPWASVKDLNGIELYQTEDYITDAGVQNSATHVVPAGSVIVSTRMTVGEPFLNKVDMAINQDMKAIIPNTSRANPLFIVYSLWDKDQYLKSLGRGTTVDGITTNDLLLTHLGLPSLEEQRKIASVIYTVDQAIHKTEDITKQIKRVRNGLRQNSFETGIDSDGTFRDIPKKELQETRIGKIPPDWDFLRLDEVCADVVDCINTTPKYSEDGILVVLTSEIKDGRYNPEDAPYVSEEVYKERIRRIEPRPDDVIFTREAPIGEAFKIPEGPRLCLGQRTIQLRAQDGILDPDYLLETLYTEKIQSWCQRVAVGSTTTHVRVGDIEGMKIPVPDIDEQRRIADLLGTYRSHIDMSGKYVEQLRRLKHGLMQDLLSGEIRTHDKDIEIIDEVLQHG